MLLIATYLLYISVAFDILFGRVRSPIQLLITIGFIIGAFGISNERRFGYKVAVVIAGANLLWEGWLVVAVSFAFIINLIFSIALFALLIHPLSREHQRIWFH